MKMNRWGINEPVFEKRFFKASDFDLVLVPVLGFDLSGNRLGYGKGYYDKFLKETRKDCLKIGLAFEISKFNGKLPVEDFDVTLDAVITEKNIFRF